MQLFFPSMKTEQHSWGIFSPLMPGHQPHKKENNLPQQKLFECLVYRTCFDRDSQWSLKPKEKGIKGKEIKE